MMAHGPIAAGLRLVAESDLAEGVSIAISGLTIVFVALVLISLFIAKLPQLLELVARVWQEVKERHSAEISGEVYPENLAPDDGAALAAIGFVLHTELQRQIAADKASEGKK